MDAHLGALLGFSGKDDKQKLHKAWSILFLWRGLLADGKECLDTRSELHVLALGNLASSFLSFGYQINDSKATRFLKFLATCHLCSFEALIIDLHRNEMTSVRVEAGWVLGMGRGRPRGYKGRNAGKQLPWGQVKSKICDKADKQRSNLFEGCNLSVKDNLVIYRPQGQVSPDQAHPDVCAKT
jgi:hypothetical protein